MVTGKRASPVRQMANVAEHAATDGARRSYRQVGEGTVEGTVPQPRFRGQLQGPMWNQVDVRDQSE